MKSDKTKEGLESSSKECFVIMPIAGNDERSSDHFRAVYRDIIAPACHKAGYSAIRADDVKSTNLIHTDILKRIIEAPLAICDLSTRNPNVLFELGIRQAFDMPVVLIQEKNTKKIFDINVLRIYEYSSTLIYSDVLEDQEKITEIISKTIQGIQESGHVNSIIKLLSITKAANLKSTDVGTKEILEIVGMLKSEVQDLRNMTRMSSRKSRFNSSHWHSFVDSLEGNSIKDIIAQIESEFMLCRNSKKNFSNSMLYRLIKIKNYLEELYENNRDNETFRLLDTVSFLIYSINEHNKNL